MHTDFGQVETATVDDVVADSPTQVGLTPSRRWRPIPVTLFLGVTVVVAYAAYERVCEKRSLI